MCMLVWRRRPRDLGKSSAASRRKDALLGLPLALPKSPPAAVVFVVQACASWEAVHSKKPEDRQSRLPRCQGAHFERQVDRQRE